MPDKERTYRTKPAEFLFLNQCDITNSDQMIEEMQANDSWNIERMNTRLLRALDEARILKKRSTDAELKVPIETAILNIDNRDQEKKMLK